MGFKRVIVVTGSSSGIGKAIALEPSLNATHVLLHGYRNIDGMQRIASELQGRGIVARCVRIDVSMANNHSRIVDLAFAWQGQVDGWVNAAGADVLTTNYRHLSFEEKLELLWKTDVVSTIAISRYVAQRMQAHQAYDGVPSIVNIGWDQAEHGMEGDSGQFFSATKSAIMAFTRSLAKTVGPKVRVNCVAPGWIRTAWGEEAPSHWNARAIGESCMSRWGTPEDVANAVSFLLSPQSSFMSGQTINVNGGWKPNLPS